MAYTEKSLYVDSVAYGPSGADGGVARWTASTAYTVGQIIRQRTAPTVTNERCFVCILAGTSLASEPTWGASPGKGVIITEAAGPKWQECTALPAMNGDLANTNSWQASQVATATGCIITNTARTHYFINQTGSNGAATEPTWNTTPGATTVENFITWLCLGPVGNFTTRWAAPAARLASIWSSSTSWTSNNGMVTYVGDDHAETISSGTMQILPSSVTNGSVICVDHTVTLPPGPADARTTATFTISSTAVFALFQNSASYVYGLQFINAGTGTFDILGGNLCQARFDNCLFSLTNTNTGLQIRINRATSVNGTQAEFKDCTFNLAAAGQLISLGVGIIKMENCAFTGVLGSGTQAIFTGPSLAGNVTIEGSDFSNLAAGASLMSRGLAGYMLIKDCKLPANMGPVFVSGDSNMFPGFVLDLVRCASDGTNYKNERHTSLGVESIATNIVRTGGAVDGNTPISHRNVMISPTSIPYAVFNCWPLVIWNDIINTDRNVTLYGIANDIRVPNNDELYVVLEYLGSASSPRGSYKRGSKASVLSAPSGLSSDSSAWDSQVPAVARSTAYVVGDAVKHASNLGRVFFCTGAGTTGANEPADGLGGWNTLDADAVLNLSADKLTVTKSGATAGGIRTTAAQTSGKFYFEHKNTHIEQFLGYPTGVCGIITGAGAFSNYTNVGATIDQQGTVWACGTRTLSVLSALVLNDVWCFAIDLTNKKFHVRLNGGNWNGNASHDPANNIGGFDISSLFPTNAAFGFAYLTGSGNAGSLLAFTSNFGQSAFAFTPPTGFLAGPFAIGYGSTVDGGSVADGSATMRAGCRFSQSLALTSPQLQQKGYLYAYPRVGRAAVPYFIDPKLRLS